MTIYEARIWVFWLTMVHLGGAPNPFSDELPRWMQN